MDRPARQYCAAEACSSDAMHLKHHYAHAGMVCQLNRLDIKQSQLVIIIAHKCPHTATRSMYATLGMVQCSMTGLASNMHNTTYKLLVLHVDLCW